MSVDWRCPKSHEPLIFFPETAGGPFYLCPASRLKYRVDQGIPVFLIEYLAIGRTLSPYDALACIMAFLLMGTVFGLGFVWNYQDARL